MEFPFPSAYTTDDQMLVRRALLHAGQPTPQTIMTVELLMMLNARALLPAAALVEERHFRDTEKELGEDMAKIANAAHEIRKHEHPGQEDTTELHKERYHSFLDTIKDPRAALLALAERTAEMQLLENMPPLFQSDFATITLRAFVPLARQMGLSELERALDRLCLALLPKWDYQRAQAESEVYEKLIAEKGYHQNKLDMCLLG